MESFDKELAKIKADLREVAPLEEGPIYNDPLQRVKYSSEMMNNLAEAKLKAEKLYADAVQIEKSLKEYSMLEPVLFDEAKDVVNTLDTFVHRIKMIMIENVREEAIVEEADGYRGFWIHHDTIGGTESTFVEAEEGEDLANAFQKYIRRLWSVQDGDTFRIEAGWSEHPGEDL